MAHDVFISYASRNKPIADAICAGLESAGIGCWVAPRDVPPGKAWPAAILEAIQSSQAMVLVFSADANASSEVLKEVTLAAKYEKALFPFRIEAVEPSGAMEYHLVTPHWLDAMKPPLETHVTRMIASLRKLLGRQVSALSPVEPRVGDVKVNPVDGQRYLWIPPGEFDMGASPGDADADQNEGPRHRVAIRKGFWMGETPVTVSSYRRFAEATDRQMPDEDLPEGETLGPWMLPQVPITLVYWEDALAYARWAALRLPTEAEWEYAARAGTTGPRYGDLDRIAWTASNSGGQPRDVRGKEPNRFGLYDMLGNVWEWTADLYRSRYGAMDPTSPETRSIRGGGWGVQPSRVRASLRLENRLMSRNDACGFRCVGD